MQLSSQMDEWDDKKHLEFDIEMALMKSPHRVKRQQPTEVLRIMAKAIVQKLSRRWTFKRKPPRRASLAISVVRKRP